MVDLKTIPCCFCLVFSQIKCQRITGNIKPRSHVRNTERRQKIRGLGTRLLVVGTGGWGGLIYVVYTQEPIYGLLIYLMAEYHVL